MRRSLFASMGLLSGISLFALLVTVSSLAAQNDPVTLRFGHFFVGAGWDPADQNNRAALVYYDPIYDSLLTMNADGDILPRLATDWAFTDDTTLVLTLRDDVVFSDGTPFTAEAAAANLERARTAGSAFVQQELAAVETITAPDPTTLQITLSQPDEFLLRRLTGYAGMMVSPAAFETASTQPVGSGPWQLNTDESIAGSFFVYERFPNHWANDDIAIDRIEVRVLSAIDGLNGLLANDLDIVKVPAGVTNLLAGADVQVLSVESTFYVLALWDRDGTMLPALADQAVRCAFQQAIDRAAYTTVTGAQALKPMDTIPPPGWYGYTDEALVRDYDPQAAAAILSDVDWTGLQAPTSPSYRSRHEAVFGYLQSIDVPVETVMYSTGDILPTIFGAEYPMSFITVEPGHFVTFVQDYVLADGGLNPFGAADAEIEALAAEAQGLSLADAEPIWQEISRLLSERCYFVPLSVGSIAVVANPDVIGLEGRFRSNGFVNLRSLSLAN